MTKIDDKHECPHCGVSMENVGIDDGAGDFVEALVNYWECPACGELVEQVIHGSEDFEDEAPPPAPKRKFSGEPGSDVPF